MLLPLFPFSRNIRIHRFIIINRYYRLTVKVSLIRVDLEWIWNHERSE